MKKIFSISLLAIILFAACKKSSPTNSCSNTMANLAGTYSIVKIEANLFGTFSDITSQFLKSCQVDDKIIMNTNGTATYTDAGTACVPDGSMAGTWSLSSAGKVSVTAGPIDVSDADIVSFDCTTLVLLYSTTYMGNPVDLRITVKK